MGGYPLFCSSSAGVYNMLLAPINRVYDSWNPSSSLSSFSRLHITYFCWSPLPHKYCNSWYSVVPNCFWRESSVVDYSPIHKVTDGQTPPVSKFDFFNPNHIKRSTAPFRRRRGNETEWQTAPQHKRKTLFGVFLYSPLVTPPVFLRVSTTFTSLMMLWWRGRSPPP